MSLLFTDILDERILPLVYVLPFVVFGGLLGTLTSRRKRVFTTIGAIIDQTNINIWGKIAHVQHLRCGFIVGLSYGLIYGLGYQQPRISLIYGTIFGLVSVLLSLLLEGKPFTLLLIKIPSWL